MKPCPGCPYSPKCPPGELGGSGITVYLGQAAGPFLLHCHSAEGYSPEASRANPDLTQCAGAAIYRANTGVAPFLPPPLLRLPEGDGAFVGPAEFICHHAKVPRVVAEVFLHDHPVAEHAARQRERSNNKLHLIPKAP